MSIRTDGEPEKMFAWVMRNGMVWEETISNTEGWAQRRAEVALGKGRVKAFGKVLPVLVTIQVDQTAAQEVKPS